MEPVHQQPVQSATKPATPPVMDVMPPRPQPAEPMKMPPQKSGALPIAKPDESAKPQKEATKKQPVVKPPKVAKNGTGLAIFAAIIIVLGLGAMMVYAYLRTNGISIQ